jgi:hypothetical protein
MSKKCNVKSALLNLAKVCPIASDLRKKKTFILSRATKLTLLEQKKNIA